MSEELQLSSLDPLGTYNLKLNPYEVKKAIDDDFSISIKISLAAIDLDNAIDDENSSSTFRIIKRSLPVLEYENENEDENDSDETSDEEERSTNKKKEKSSTSKKYDESDEESRSNNNSDDNDDKKELSDLLDDDVSSFVICTLNPKIQFQQALELFINPRENISFIVTGSYPIHLSGNYIHHPFDDASSDDELYESSDEEDDLADENLHKIQEIVEDDVDKDGEITKGGNNEKEAKEEKETKKAKSEKKLKKESKKKAKEENGKKKEGESKRKVLHDNDIDVEDEKSSKKSKKEKHDKKEKKIKFSEELEQGPTKKSSPKTIQGGVIIDDRKIGEGAIAKKGDKIGVRYIGQIKDGKVFDSNTKGKPFYFHLGKGEVIKGWDVGVAGMKIKGERRIVIPSSMAYGKKALPGIPANSELIFDVKLVAIK